MKGIPPDQLKPIRDAQAKNALVRLLRAMQDQPSDPPMPVGEYRTDRFRIVGANVDEIYELSILRVR